MGVAYKRNIDGVRESPALDVMLLLRRRARLIVDTRNALKGVTSGKIVRL